MLSIILIVLAFLGFGKTASNSMSTDNMQQAAGGVLGSFGLIALGGFINTIGLGLTIAGGVTIFIAHRREITAYTTQQVMPIAQEGIEKMTPTISNAAGTIAKSIAKGINEGQKESNEDKENFYFYKILCYNLFNRIRRR